MKAMILAAGRGERMRPLTDSVPKPLLKVAGKPLIVYHIERLAAAGFREIIVNIAHLGQMIPEALGDGSEWGVKLLYSDERQEGALESAGGIIKALPLVDGENFLVVNGDVWTDYPFDPNVDMGGNLAHLILVPNPEHNPEGDFGLADGVALSNAEIKYTFSGIGYYAPELFSGFSYGRRSLGPLLRERMLSGAVGAELFDGVWRDIGTPERLSEINAIAMRGDDQ